MKKLIHLDIKKIFKINNSEDRSQLLEKAGFVKNYIKSIEQLLNAAYKNQISNHLIASVNSMAYQDMRSRAKKYLAKRAQTTVKILNEAEEAVTKHSKSLDITFLEEKYKALVKEIGNCVLTTNNFI